MRRCAAQVPSPRAATSAKRSIVQGRTLMTWWKESDRKGCPALSRICTVRKACAAVRATMLPAGTLSQSSAWKEAAVRRSESPRCTTIAVVLSVRSSGLSCAAQCTLCLAVLTCVDISSACCEWLRGRSCWCAGGAVCHYAERQTGVIIEMAAAEQMCAVQRMLRADVQQSWRQAPPGIPFQLHMERLWRSLLSTNPCNISHTAIDGVACLATL
jgi:hypothetical protein